MKTLYLFGILLFFTKNVTSQTVPDYPFEFEKSGNGTESIVFIPGFASSGEVWAETRLIYEKTHTCYTLTMAGFAGVPPKENSNFEEWKSGIANFIQREIVD